MYLIFLSQCHIIFLCTPRGIPSFSCTRSLLTTKLLLSQLTLHIHTKKGLHRVREPQRRQCDGRVRDARANAHPLPDAARGLPVRRGRAPRLPPRLQAGVRPLARHSVRPLQRHAHDLRALLGHEGQPLHLADGRHQVQGDGGLGQVTGHALGPDGPARPQGH